MSPDQEALDIESRLREFRGSVPVAAAFPRLTRDGRDEWSGGSEAEMGANAQSKFYNNSWAEAGRRVTRSETSERIASCVSYASCSPPRVEAIG